MTGEPGFAPRCHAANVGSPPSAPVLRRDAQDGAVLRHRPPRDPVAPGRERVHQLRIGERDGLCGDDVAQAVLNARGRTEQRGERDRVPEGSSRCFPTTARLTVDS